MDLVLGDRLGGVMVLRDLGLSLDHWLDLLYDVLVDVFMDYGSVYGGRMGLLANVAGMLMVTLSNVLARSFVSDVLMFVSTDNRSSVLVVGVLLLLIIDGLDLLVDIDLLSLPIDDGSDFMVCMSRDVLVCNSVLDVSSMGSTNSVINDSLGRSAISESLRTSVLAVVVSLILRSPGFLVRHRVHDLIYQAHIF